MSFVLLLLLFDNQLLRYVLQIALHLTTYFSENSSHMGIAQNSRLREIPSDMPLGKHHSLSLKEQRNLPDLLAIALQPFFSKLATICRMALSYRVAGCSQPQTNLIAVPITVTQTMPPGSADVLRLTPITPSACNFTALP